MIDRPVLDRAQTAVRMAVAHLFAPRELVWTVAACAAFGGIIWRLPATADAGLSEQDVAFISFCIVLALASAGAWRRQL